ncbi:hypothetical protein [Streptomyces sp. NPDC004680]|uniref:hypothetical protein n=1 Tax=unclassified Streptomyces TaxID=2593676 RepID=UPI0033B104EB
MTEAPRTRAPLAELTEVQRRRLDQAQDAIGRALKRVEVRREEFADLAAQVAIGLGRGGASAVARHFGWTPQHASALVAAYRAKQDAEGGNVA